MTAFLALRREHFFLILKSLSIRNLMLLAARNVLYVNHYYILEMRLNDRTVPPQSKPPRGELSLLTANDLPLLKTELESFNEYDKKELLARLVFYESGFRNCYLLKINGVIAYLGWLIYPTENELIQRSYRRRFLPLKEKQVMIENSFTFPRYRGFGYMPCVTLELLRKAKNEGYSGAVCYVVKENVNVLNHLVELGFKLRRIVREYKLLGYAWRRLGNGGQGC